MLKSYELMEATQKLRMPPIATLNCQVTKTVMNSGSLSELKQIVKIITKLSTIVKIVKNCLPITLIKCFKGHKSCHVLQNQKVGHSLSDNVTYRNVHKLCLNS